MSKQDLINTFNKFNEKHTFEPGQIVEWKHGMKTKRAEGPFVVQEVLSKPINDEGHGAGSPYFKEPLDIILAYVDSDGDYIFHHYDSRRFQPAD